jgi:hypothetical protein
MRRYKMEEQRKLLIAKKAGGVASQFSTVPQMAINGAQICDLELTVVRFAIQWYNMAIRPSISQ